jgi:hypothetical protein
MKTLETQSRPLFLGVLDGIAEAPRTPPRRASDRDGLPDWEPSFGGGSCADGRYIERADSVSEALDRWLWKQRARELRLGSPSRRTFSSSKRACASLNAGLPPAWVNGRKSEVRTA